MTACPLIIGVSKNADEANCRKLESVGVEIWRGNDNDRDQRLLEFLKHLGKREFTNVLVEGGSELLGSLSDLGQIDEIHCFIGPKIVGGQAKTPLGSRGIELMSDARHIRLQKMDQLGDDVYLVGRVNR